MKIIPALAPALLLAATSPAVAGIVAGPIVNPNNGHDYYLLEPQTWAAAETEAESLGGTLAVIRNAAEAEWVYSKFGAADGTKRDLWIGLHRKVAGGPFFWPDDEPMDYTDWYPGEPNNVGGNENGVEMKCADDHPGAWNDLAGANLLCGVVEVPGEANPETVNWRERALVGDWHVGGRVDRPCYIASTGRWLFAIHRPGNRADRLILTPGKRLFLSGRNVYGEIIKDKILWSDGQWWSRAPAKSEAAEKSETAGD